MVCLKFILKDEWGKVCKSIVINVNDKVKKNKVILFFW